MADIGKYGPFNGGTLISDFKTHFSIFRTKRTVATAYGFVFIFIAFTIFLAFTPSTNSSSPWFTNIFTVSDSTSYTTSSSVLSDASYRSHFSSILYYIYPNSSEAQSSSPTDHGKSQYSNSTSESPSAKENQTKIEEKHPQFEVQKHNQTQNEEFRGEDEVVKANQSAIAVTISPEASNETVNSSANSASVANNASAIGETGSAQSGAVESLNSSSPMKNQNNGNDTAKSDQWFDDLIKPLLNCDFFDGNWVRDDSYPLYKPGSCSLIDEQFNCFANGRPDNNYHKLKWKPKGCTLPRLNGSHMLELLRGKRLVFVGDSLNRNMWESLICILRNSVKDQKKVYEASGKHFFRSEASYSFVFEDYKFTVDFFVTPFLVQEWEVTDKNGTKKETLRLDLISKFADKYKDADFIVFNTGHWWTHDKTSLGKDYYQEGSHVYSELNVDEAFRKAMTTWGRWIDTNVNPRKSLVFYRGYSASHFSGGQWNSGGQCDNETEPITNDAYLSQYPSKMTVLERVMKGMKTRVTYMNVTKMTDYRKDGHPSIHRKQHSFDLMIQDCSHWCLPGVPDIWNELLYAEILVKLYENGKLKE